MLMASLVLSEQPSLMVILGAMIVLVSVLALNLERGGIPVPVGKI
jgi:drug/metabolite transporter (DMT)-like permease